MAKSKYGYWLTEEGLLLIRGWARDGLTEEQIAKNIGISRSTLREWKTKYPAISATLKKGKDVVDRQVEEALIKSLMGYNTVEITKERNIKTGELEVTREVIKEVPPNITALIFWLKNRKPKQWRETANDPKNKAEVKYIKAKTEQIKGGEQNNTEDKIVKLFDLIGGELDES